MRRLLAILIIASAAAAPAAAQEHPSLLAAIAEVIHDALPPASSTGPGDSWDAVSIRISRHVHWHLAPPDKADASDTRRKGWIEADGQQAGVTAHGDAERVTSLSFQLRGGTRTSPDDRDLLAALAKRGVTVTDTQLRPYSSLGDAPITGSIHTLVAEGRSGARLSSTPQCTPPESRAARRCWVIYELNFGT